MELTSEDNLRLNVLFAQNLKAVRIDESKMIVYGLSERGEAKVVLHPNCRDEKYIKAIRELLSSHFIGSPGGYPVYLRRWTRMGQAKDQSLEKLLLLGEPEAVVAVVNAAGLTPELAAWAWWALPNAYNARSMLNNPVIVNSEIGKELATYLVEYLPFEQEPIDMIETVRLVLQGHLINEEMKQQLWAKGRAKNAYYIGFLATTPDDLPEKVAAHPDYDKLEKTLLPLTEKNNPFAKLLLNMSSIAGQSWLETAEKVLRKPNNQDVVNILFDVIANHFKSIRPDSYNDEMDITNLIEKATNYCEDENNEAIQQVLAVLPEMKSNLIALLVLSGLRYSILRPVFSATTAIGSLMRKKLMPVTTPIFEQVAILRGRQ